MQNNENDNSLEKNGVYKPDRGIDVFEKRGGIGENPPPTSMKPGFKKTGK